VHCHQVIGTAVPASDKNPQGLAEAAGDQRSDLRRQAVSEILGFRLRPAGRRRRKRKSSCRATRLPRFFGIEVSKAGRERGFPKKGRGTSGGFRWKCSLRIGVSAGRLDQTVREPLGELDGRSDGLLLEGAARWNATPELVSQDREAGLQTHSWGRDQGRSNTGRSFARRIGGWQQCRPPFRLGNAGWQQCRPLFFVRCALALAAVESAAESSEIDPI